MLTLENPESIDPNLTDRRKTAVLFVLSACPFCRRFRPIFESFAGRKSVEFDFLTVVLDDYSNPLWDDYAIEVVPTVLIFEGKKIARRLDGRPGEGLSAGDLEKL